MERAVDASELSAELDALRQQLREEEAEWAKWRESHKLRTSDIRSEGLQALRNRIHLLEAKLLRMSR